MGGEGHHNTTVSRVDMIRAFLNLRLPLSTATERKGVFVLWAIQVSD